jgi:hypothetical protein
MSDAQFEEWARIWKGFQQDLVSRSPRGQLHFAAESGHFIQIDQPELVNVTYRDGDTDRKFPGPLD